MIKDDKILERITELLKQHNWSRYRLAEESGIPKSTLNNMFKRNHTPSIHTLLKICSGFQIGLGEFFQENDAGFAFTDKDLELLTLYRQLGPSERRMVLASIMALAAPVSDQKIHIHTDSDDSVPN